MLEKFEYADVAAVDVDEDELSLEPDSDSTAWNRSCTNFLNACRVCLVESVVLLEETELVEVGFSLQFAGGLFDEKGIEIPIWLNACMMLCINELFPSDFDCPTETWVPELVSLLLDCWTTEKSIV